MLWDSDAQDRVTSGATAESSAERRIEGNGATPARALPECVLPYSDRDRLGTLLANLQPRLTAVALRLARDPDAARDIVQSAFEKVVRHGSDFRGEARVSTWVHRIVVNEALMWLRSERRQRWMRADKEAEQAHVADPGPDPAEPLERRQRRQRLLNGLMSLSHDERDVVVRCALEGLSYADYAERVDAHAAAVKSRAHRARRRLRTLLSVAEDLSRISA
jgi:RNA polymerase sigma-70 factor (ECF subfamily)